MSPVRNCGQSNICLAKTWIMRYGNGINPCSRSCPESMAAVLSWWMYIKDVMRMLLRVLSIGWGMTGTR